MKEDLPGLDQVDRRILLELQQDGRMTNVEIARRADITAPPCLRRVRRLEERKVISQYVALVDPDAVGLHVTAFIRVRLHQQGEHHLGGFERAIAGFPEVMECYLMTGEADYQLRVVVPSLEAFEQFLRSKLTRIESVSSVTTSLALRPVVYRTRIGVDG